MALSPRRKGWTLLRSTRLDWKRVILVLSDQNQYIGVLWEEVAMKKAGEGLSTGLLEGTVKFGGGSS